MQCTLNEVHCHHHSSISLIPVLNGSFSHILVYLVGPLPPSKGLFTTMAVSPSSVNFLYLFSQPPKRPVPMPISFTGLHGLVSHVILLPTMWSPIHIRPLELSCFLLLECSFSILCLPITHKAMVRSVCIAAWSFLFTTASALCNGLSSCPGWCLDCKSASHSNLHNSCNSSLFPFTGYIVSFFGHARHYLLSGGNSLCCCEVRRKFLSSDFVYW